MRINKYRGRRSYDKKWIYGSLLIDNNGDFHILESNIIEKDGHHIHIDSDSPMFFDNDTIGQFTGLHDKNGVEIYEGDVVEIGFEFGFYVFSVSYDLEFCSYFYTNIDCKDDVYAIGEFVDDVEKIKVIGNIHERSEDNDK